MPHFTRDFSNPHTLYYIAKEVDNHPGEGTFVLSFLRAVKYYLLPYRQFFYEPVSTLDQLHLFATVRFALEQ